ncbi:dihydrofolate reductase [Pontibacter diazotrophicus]|uniref:Dihydrofolate reductase n=1 Tax=Pontibacter diazotrophicus TaxID=1400979 RepID=A0A3D8LE13_9BACT|nr:dihydrofolate reductase family protein [Pontibacter diazotrophicus]RDV15637.1 dihydrofolate reductase [Pontibacter diazotrophicus]
MRKIVLYIAASLDGYIARSNGSTAWLHDETYTIKGEDFGYSEFLQTFDTTLMGHSTYKVVLGFDMPFPYPDKENYVFSRSSGHTDTEYVQFISTDAVEFVQKLKQKPGKDIWLIGGGQLNTLLLNHNLIDEIILTYVPRVLGEGIPLFAPGAQEKKLKVRSSKSYDNGFVQVRLGK